MHYNNSHWNDYKKTPHEGHDHFHKEVKKVAKPLTIEDLFPKLDRWAIGYTNTLDSLQQLAKAAKAPSYPPYNILKFEGGKWRVEMAVAGLVREDISITVKDQVLTVSATTDLEVTKAEDAEVIHHGIAQRNFETTFALAEFVEVESARMEDGILTIDLVTNVPEEKKPKSIEIK
jgi:molecular chaperone IbpA